MHARTIIIIFVEFEPNYHLNGHNRPDAESLDRHLRPMDPTLQAGERQDEEVRANPLQVAILVRVLQMLRFYMRLQ